MIPNLIQRLTTLSYEYDTAIEQQRAQRLLSIAGAVIILSTLWFVFISVPLIIQGTNDEFDIVAPLAAVGISAILMRLIQRGQVLWSARIFIVFLFVVTVPFEIEFVNSPVVINAIIPIILAGILLDIQALFVVTAIALLVTMRSFIFAPPQSGITASEIWSVAITLVLSSFFLGLFKQSMEDLTRSASRLLVQVRGLNRAVDIPNDVPDRQRYYISHAISTLRNELGFSYIRVVLLDDDQQPMQTYYSSIGVEQIAQTTAFSFTRNSAFQQALDSKTPQLVSPQDSTNLASHLLPASTSGIVIPAQSLNYTVALFDIQTESVQTVTTEMVSILSLFASQVATQLLYHRTVSTLENDIREQEALIERQRQQILRIQNLQTEGIVADWEGYLQLRGANTIGYDIDNKRELSHLNVGTVPEALRPAFEKNDIVVEMQGDEQIVIIPIRLRDSVLGAMSFTIPKELPITERKIDFIRSVTERLALALDNKRLLEQTQTQAEREGIANEIGSLLLRSTDVETVLQTAADRFNEALGAITTQIYLQPSSLRSIENPQREDIV